MAGKRKKSGTKRRYSSPSEVTFLVKLPTRLHGRIKRAATMHNVSMHATILKTLNHRHGG